MAGVPVPAALLQAQLAQQPALSLTAPAPRMRGGFELASSPPASASPMYRANSVVSHTAGAALGGGRMHQQPGVRRGAETPASAPAAAPPGSSPPNSRGEVRCCLLRVGRATGCAASRDSLREQMLTAPVAAGWCCLHTAPAHSLCQSVGCPCARSFRGRCRSCVCSGAAPSQPACRPHLASGPASSSRWDPAGRPCQRGSHTPQACPCPQQWRWRWERSVRLAARAGCWAR